MATSKLELEMHIDAGDIQQVSDFLRVVFENYDQLPPAVAEAAEVFADCGGDVYDKEYLMRRDVSMKGLAVYVDGHKADGVEAGHPIGRRVVFWQKPDAVADSFWIVINGEFICGWGEKPEIEVINE